MAGEQYPKRDSHFAHKFVRLLQKSCAAMDIGHAACLLVTYIAHTEDAARYSGPVRFWNEQLMTTLAFNSQKQLRTARDKAIEFGWLVYQRDNDRSVGKYWVAIPERFSVLSDSLIEEPIVTDTAEVSDSLSSPVSCTNLTNKQDNERTTNGTTKGQEVVQGMGQPSNPNPNPNPNPNNSFAPPFGEADGRQEDFRDDGEDLASAIDTNGDPITFPVQGNKREWILPADKLAEYQQSFPGLDVVAEMMKARQWCRDNKANRKTPRGMPAFLGKWLGRAVDRGGHNRGSPRPHITPGQQKLQSTLQAAWEFGADEREANQNQQNPISGYLG